MKYQWYAHKQTCIDWKSGEEIATVEYGYRIVGKRRWVRFQIVGQSLNSVISAGEKIAIAHVKLLAKSKV